MKLEKDRGLTVLGLFLITATLILVGVLVGSCHSYLRSSLSMNR